MCITSLLPLYAKDLLSHIINGDENISHMLFKDKKVVNSVQITGLI